MFRSRNQYLKVQLKKLFKSINRYTDKNNGSFFLEQWIQKHTYINLLLLPNIKYEKKYFFKDLFRLMFILGQAGLSKGKKSLQGIIFSIGIKFLIGVRNENKTYKSNCTENR